MSIQASDEFSIKIYISHTMGVTREKELEGTYIPYQNYSIYISPESMSKNHMLTKKIFLIYHV